MNTLGFMYYATLVIVGLVGCLTFLIGYTIKSRPKWWHSDVGRHLFAFSALFTVLYSRSAILLFDSDTRTALMNQSQGTVIFIYFVSLVAAVVVWQRTWIFLRAQWNDRRREDDN